VPIDPGVAELIADKQQKSNQAYSDAGYLRMAVIAMYVFLALSVSLFTNRVSGLHNHNHLCCRGRAGNPVVLQVLRSRKQRPRLSNRPPILD
jgi:hypothetical protein